MGWIDRWCRNSSVKSDRLIVDVGARITEAFLDPENDSPGDPAHAEAVIRLHPEKSDTESTWREQRWLFAEAWWAKSFAPPQYFSIVRWAFMSVPWTFVSHFERRLRRVGFAARNTPTILGKISALPAWFGEWLRLMIGLLLIPIVLLLVVLILVLSLVPIDAVREVALSLQRLLSQTIGDSYTLVASPTTAAAIATRVRHDLDWLAERCERVVVIAHSQGAAIAHRVLRGPPGKECAMLLSFGSGLQKLAEIERAAASRAGWTLWGATIAALCSANALYGSAFGASLLQATLTRSWVRGADPRGALGAVTVVAALSLAIYLRLLAPPSIDRREIGGSHIGARIAVYLMIGASATLPMLAEQLHAVDTLYAWLGSLALALVAGVISMRAWGDATGRSWDPDTQIEMDRQTLHQRFDLRNESIDWVDVYSTDDPVPNGPLLDELLPARPRSHCVFNRRSVLWDHTTYWENGEQFVARCCWTLLNLTGIDANAVVPNSTVITDARTARRAWRTAWTLGCRRSVSLAIGCAFVFYHSWSPPPIGDLVALLNEWLHGLFGVPDLGGLGLNDNGLLTLGGALACAIVACGLQFSISRLHKWWERLDDIQMAARRSFASAPPPMLISVALSVAVLGTVIASLPVSVGPLHMALGLAAPMILVALVPGGVTGARSYRTHAVSGEVRRAVRRLRRWYRRKLQTWALRHHVGALMLHGMRLYDARSWAEAEVAWRTAYERAPAAAAYWLGKLLSEHGRSEEARQVLQKGADLGDRGAAEELYDQIRKVGAPETEYRSALERASALGSAAAFSWLGDLDADAGRIDEAEQNYATASLAGHDYACWRLGVLRRTRGDIAGARSAFEVGGLRGSIESSLDLGRLLESDGDAAGADRAYRRVLELVNWTVTVGSSGSTALAALGRLQLDAGRIMSGTTTLRLGSDLGSDECCLALGEVLEEQAADGRTPERDWAGPVKTAADAYRRGMDLGSAECAYRFGRTLEQDGDYQGALNAYARGAKEWHPDARSAFTRLRSERPWLDVTQAPSTDVDDAEDGIA